MTPGTLNLTAYRWVPFVYTIDIVGYDLSAATFAAQVRVYPDAPGEPLVSLTNASAGAEGISASVTTDGDGVPTTSIVLQVNETTIEALHYDENGGDAKLAWDLVISGTGLVKSRWLQGDFVISAGVTQ